MTPIMQPPLELIYLRPETNPIIFRPSVVRGVPEEIGENMFYHRFSLAISRNRFCQAKTPDLCAPQYRHAASRE